MDDAKFFIKGLEGQRTLSGKIPVRGAKNSVLKAFAASLLFDDGIRVDNVPFIQDIDSMAKLLRHLGVEVNQTGERSFFLKPPASISTDLSDEIAKSFRSSIVLSGPILAKEGKVSFPHPGGCVIGERPIDIFLESFEKMGAKTRKEGEKYVITANKLRGAEIVFKTPSVTATETLMMTGVLTPGTTILHNVACEPEIVALAEFLNDGGAQITGAGTHTIVVKGVKSLKTKKPFQTPPDRIETGSFAILAGICGKDVEIIDCQPEYLKVFLRTLRNIGVNIKETKASLRIQAPEKLRAIDVKTREYPGIPTDLQSPLAVLMTQAEGRSFIFETVFEGRLNWLNELVRMGADITICDPYRAIVSGPTPLRGRELESPDLRAGLAFIIAGLIAKGDSILHNISNIDRGYEKVEDRLAEVGADIKRIN
ncbi:MAG: UDP-N-acetylglucosamine 1-carboxyvinyltransferase [Nanoarchaeota archaeon]|nr:UDP-N-acetylglucosamine 1-carboxyvinyltransferase [Nanoarchaeota archaeon]